MADASKKMGAGAKGKGSGAGALTDMPEHLLKDNQVLSNRDKKGRSKREDVDTRGQDSKWLQSEQRKDHEANRR
jgi:hypothetical protein